MTSLKNSVIKGLKLIIRYGLIVMNDGFICLKPNPKMAIFESFNGNDINDNPAAIYREWVATHPELQKWAYFSVKPRVYASLHAKYPDVQLLRRFSPKWVWVIAHSKLWVFNSRMPAWWRKNRRTIYIQTWHGTPLKHLGADIEHVAIPGSETLEYGRQFVREASRWQYLIAPNAYSRDIFKSAFQFHHEFLPIGYPRNDVLYQHNDVAKIQALKQDLVGDPTATVILYAPTWRDDDAIKSGEYHFTLSFDLGRFFEQVSPDTVLVLRPHYLVKDKIDISGFEDRVKILADEDISDLYLIADLLVTDYSSVMFDYANLKRPMLFYAYDLAHYRDELRGFYFDYQAEIPGPLATTEAELLNALKVFNEKHCFPAYKTQLVGFNDKYCQWEDGTASQRVVEVMEKEMAK